MFANLIGFPYFVRVGGRVINLMQVREVVEGPTGMTVVWADGGKTTVHPASEDAWRRLFGPAEAGLVSALRNHAAPSAPIPTVPDPEPDNRRDASDFVNPDPIAG